MALAQGRVDLQSGNLTLGGGGLLNAGRTGSGTSGSADGDLAVAGNVVAPTLTVVGVTGVGSSSGDATGVLTIGGSFDAQGLNGLQVGSAGGSGTATGSASVGVGIANASTVLVGGGGGDPNATGASNGTLTVLAGGIHGGNNMSVGFGAGPGQTSGQAVVEGGISVADGVSVGRVDDAGSGLGSGDASGVLNLLSGDLILGGGGFLNVGRTGSGTSGSADGDLAVAGNVIAPTLTVVGVTGVGASSGDATGVLTIGGSFDAQGLDGLQVGSAGGSGTATGSATVGAGIVNASTVLVGGGGDPNASGVSSGTLTVLAGGIHGGNNVSVGFGGGPGQTSGQVVVDGGISVASSVSVGRVDDHR